MMTPEQALQRVNFEYVSKAELRRIARGALYELLVTRELIKKQRGQAAKND